MKDKEMLPKCPNCGKRPGWIVSCWVCEGAEDNEIEYRELAEKCRAPATPVKAEACPILFPHDCNSTDHAPPEPDYRALCGELAVALERHQSCGFIGLGRAVDGGGRCGFCGELTARPLTIKHKETCRTSMDAALLARAAKGGPR